MLAIQSVDIVVGETIVEDSNVYKTYFQIPCTGKSQLRNNIVRNSIFYLVLFIVIDRNSLINDTLPRTDGEEEEGVGDEEGPQRAKRAAPRRHTIDSPHFVETMIAADWSMQQYHGSDLTLYLTTMMNIVSKQTDVIYKIYKKGTKLILICRRLLKEQVAVQLYFCTSFVPLNVWDSSI